MWSFQVRIVKLSKKNSKVRPFCSAACWCYPRKEQINFPYFLDYIWFGWILTSWFMLCSQIWGRENQFSRWAAEYLAQELSHWAKSQGRRLSDYVTRKRVIWFPSSIIYPAYQVEKSSLHVHLNEKTKPNLWKFNFVLERSTHVSKQETLWCP